MKPGMGILKPVRSVLMINMGGISTKLLFWLLMCPRCIFEVDIKTIGHQMVTYGQKIACECPTCKEQIIKTVGIDLGVIEITRTFP